jgi:hypothetical protein
MAADNSPLILTAIGVAGTITTAVLSAKAGAHAKQNLSEKSPWLTPREKVELNWKFFIPPVLTGAGTIACIICANRIGTRRAAAMAAAFAVSQETFTEYKSKVIEKIGENKERAVRDEIAQEQVRKRPASELSLVEGATDVLCYEQFTGRYFASSMETLKSAQNSVNHLILSGDNSASLSDFYDRVGLNHTQLSDEVGWNLDNMLELTFSTTMDELDRPVLTFDYKVVPVRNYFRIH